MRKKLIIGKASITIILLNGFLITVILVTAIYWFMNAKSIKDIPNSNISIFFLFSILSVLLNSLIVIHDKYSLKRADNRFSNLKNTISQIERLNITLRAQRHDFLNQLQVIYSLLEMDEFDEAKNYIESVYRDILKVNKFLKTASPAVNALLQAKIFACEKEKINVELKVSSQLKDLKIPVWELCRVLGNLIDNSIYALKEKKCDRRLEIEIYQDLKYAVFKISDNGAEIDKKNLDKVFLPGFTTKGALGEGMGLSIVKETVEINGGSIEVKSSPVETVFEVRIPR